MAQADIKSLSLDELTDEMAVLGLPKYRAEQIFEWLHRKCRIFLRLFVKNCRIYITFLLQILKKNRFPVMMKR